MGMGALLVPKIRESLRKMQALQTVRRETRRRTDCKCPKRTRVYLEKP